MQLFRALLLVMVGHLLVACARVSPAEEKVVGTWEYSGVDSSPRLVLRSDRIEVVLVSDRLNNRHVLKWAPASWGQWQLDGKTIVISNDHVFGLDGPRPVGETRRIPIQEFHTNRLVLGDGTPDLVRLSAEEGRRVKSLSTAYIAGGIMAIASMIVTMLRAFGRRRRVLLIVAGVCAASFSLLALLGELAGLGYLIISPKLLVWLQMPRDVVKIGFLTVLLLMLTAANLRLNRRQLHE
jgi:hypothetical protein